MSAPTITAFDKMLTVFAPDAHACAGFVLRRRHQFEAYTVDDRSLGTFSNAHDAVGAIIEPPTERK